MIELNTPLCWTIGGAAVVFAAPIIFRARERFWDQCGGGKGPPGPRPTPAQRAAGKAAPKELTAFEEELERAANWSPGRESGGNNRKPRGERPAPPPAPPKPKFYSGCASPNQFPDYLWVDPQTSPQTSVSSPAVSISIPTCRACGIIRDRMTFCPRCGTVVYRPASEHYIERSNA